MALQNEDLLVIQREDSHFKVQAQDLLTFTNVGDYLPLSGGIVTGEITFTGNNPINFGPGTHTIEVDTFDGNDQNVISNYSSLNFRLGPSTDSEFSIGDADTKYFTINGQGGVYIKDVTESLTRIDSELRQQQDITTALDAKIDTVQEEISDAVDTSNEYTDSVSTTTLTSANEYSDSVLDTAKSYTDEEVKSANEYTDEKIDSINIPVIPTDIVKNSGDNQVTQSWTIDAGERRYISVKDDSLGLYHVKDPSNDDHATNKKYVDDLVSGTTSFVTDEFESRDETIGALNLSINSFESDLNTKLPLAGGTLTGDIRFQPEDNGRLSIHVNNAAGQGGLDLRLGGNTYTNTFRIMGGSNAETELFKVSADTNTVFLKDHVKTSDLEDYATKIYTDTAVQGAKDYSDEKFSDVNVDTSSFATLEYVQTLLERIETLEQQSGDTEMFEPIFKQYTVEAEENIFISTSTSGWEQNPEKIWNMVSGYDAYGNRNDHKVGYDSSYSYGIFLPKPWLDKKAKELLPLYYTKSTWVDLVPDIFRISSNNLSLKFGYPKVETFYEVEGVSLMFSDRQTNRQQIVLKWNNKLEVMLNAFNDREYGIIDGPTQPGKENILEIKSEDRMYYKTEGKGTQDDQWSFKSDNRGNDNTTAYREYTATHDGMVYFKSWVDSETYDKMKVVIGGTTVYGPIGGYRISVENQQFPIKKGEVIRFEYKKDSSKSEYSDRMEILNMWSRETLENE